MDLTLLLLSRRILGSGLTVKIMERRRTSWRQDREAT
jgi:hypothetical protein